MQEASRLRRRCSGRTTALKSCEGANGASAATACKQLAADADLCYSQAFGNIFIRFLFVESKYSIMFLHAGKFYRKQNTFKQRRVHVLMRLCLLKAHFGVSYTGPLPTKSSFMGKMPSNCCRGPVWRLCRVGTPAQPPVVKASVVGSARTAHSALPA